MLKDPFSAGNITLNNRLVMPPMATRLSTEDGKVTEPLLEYYAKRARGGRIGMIVVEHSYIDLSGKASAGQLSIASDDDIKGLRRLAEVIRQSGTRAVAQINHAGSRAPFELTGRKAVSASALIHPRELKRGEEVIPEEMTREEIGTIVQKFAAAAARAEEAGFDGAEIHCAHGYLLNQFYSPLTNHRTDEYGGSLEKRTALLREVTAAVRKTVGQDFMISVRLGGCDYREGGSTVEDAVYAAAEIEKTGADMISVSGGMCGYVREGHDEPGYFQDMSRAIREAVGIPVLLTGGIKKAEEAENLLESGAADLIGVGRELLKDPYWADKI
ncbi:MAG: NADH:flavin oxidoreductase [Lachnospiraceae bacterium]|nr:NADH:flavin oxidoreductase [Lachnospiraceae bacterium]